MKPLSFLPTALLATALALSGCTEPSQTDIARGNVLASRGKIDEAAQAYRSAAAAAPGAARPRELLGHLLYDQKRVVEAQAAYEEALKVDPRGALEARIGLARLDADAGRVDAAMDRLAEVLKQQPGNLYALLSRANLAISRGKPGDAEIALQDTAQAMAVDAKSESVLYTRGAGFLLAQKPDEAAATFELLKTAHPRSYLGVYGSARVEAARGNKERALALLRQARERAADRPGAWRAEEIKADSAFARFKDDPDFNAAVAGP